MLSKDAKIYVAGHRGLVGSAIWDNLMQRGYTNLVGRTHSQLDLTCQQAVADFFDQERPQAVVLAAAHVGGIMANSRYRADFIAQNLQIQCNVITQAYAHGVSRLLFLGSTCIYPREAPQPIAEEALLTSPLEYTNEPYAIAKIAGLKMCEAYNLQHGTDYIAVMPTNLYGPNDNFHLENSHVMPGIMRKLHLARLLSEERWPELRRDLSRRPVDGVGGEASAEAIVQALAHYGIASDSVTLWGTGRPLREFLWSRDMADASVHMLLNVSFADILRLRHLDPARDEVRNTHVNIGTGKEVTIGQLAQLLARITGFEGKVLFDPAKPDGTPRKLTDVTVLHNLGWHHIVELDDGAAQLYQWYLDDLGRGE